MRVLVLVQDYPNEAGGRALAYVHTRNLYYHSSGEQVTVLNFSAKENYNIEGISVITLETYQHHNNQYGVLLLHAANLKNHYRFLKKYGSRFPRYIFFFHGHEVLKINEVYSKPYSYMKENRKLLNNIYDNIKLLVWRRYFKKNSYKADFVFVSKWMLEKFIKYIRLDQEDLYKRTHIIYNSVGREFEEETFDANVEKEYDLITIRPNIDGSKYCIDVVVRIAEKNPSLRFLLVGKGKYFNYNSKPDNIIWENRTLNHKEIVEYLRKARCALLPTRVDAQGVMACEIATFGMPLIASDIPVMHEVLTGFNHVALISNKDKDFNLSQIIQELLARTPCKKNDKFFKINTIQKELGIIREDN